MITNADTGILFTWEANQMRTGTCARAAEFPRPGPVPCGFPRAAHVAEGWLQFRQWAGDARHGVANSGRRSLKPTAHRRYPAAGWSSPCCRLRTVRSSAATSLTTCRLRRERDRALDRAQRNAADRHRDGGVIGQSGITYDQNGNATGGSPRRPSPDGKPVPGGRLSGLRPGTARI